jgi:hypothetical protein
MLNIHINIITCRLISKCYSLKSFLDYIRHCWCNFRLGITCKGGIWKAKLINLVEQEKLFDLERVGNIASVSQVNIIFN